MLQSPRPQRKAVERSNQNQGHHLVDPPSEIWFNPTTDRYTTVPNHPGDMPEVMLRAFLRQAAIAPDDFIRDR